MIKYLGLLIASVVVIIMMIILGWGVQTRLEKNLQLEMEENATLRRTIVELEEENKVFQEIFNCFTLKEELGLIEEGGP